MRTRTEGVRRLGRDRTLRRIAGILAGEPAWVTGGYVRDLLLGLRPDEADLVVPGDTGTAGTAARKLAEGLGARPHLVGTAPRAVWRIEAPDLKVEIWPLGRLSLREDALRRDFTCNALQWRLPAGPLEDPAGGLADLRSRVLRAISRANLEHDPVRVLRAARLAAQLPGFRIEPRTEAWVRDLAPAVAFAPRERVGNELLRMLEGPAPSLGLDLLVRLDLLRHTAPPGAEPRPFRVGLLLPALHRLRYPLRGLPRLATADLRAARLAVILAAWGAAGTRSVAAYAWPGEVRDRARVAAGHLPAILHGAAATARGRRELMARLGEAFPAAFAVGASLAASAGLPPGPWRRWWRQWLRTGRKLAGAPPLLGAEEVMEVTGVSPGPELGRLLKELRNARIRGEIRTAGGARRWLRGVPRRRVGMMGAGEEGET